MKHDEIMNFFEVLTTLREEYAKSNYNNKVEMISSLAQVCVEVIKQGEIPHSFQVEHQTHDSYIIITPVKELFRRLSIELDIINQGYKRVSPTSEVCYVTFLVK